MWRRAAVSEYHCWLLAWIAGLLAWLAEEVPRDEWAICFDNMIRMGHFFLPVRRRPYPLIALLCVFGNNCAAVAGGGWLERIKSILVWNATKIDVKNLYKTNGMDWPGRLSPTSRPCHVCCVCPFIGHRNEDSRTYLIEERRPMLYYTVPRNPNNKIIFSRRIVKKWRKAFWLVVTHMTREGERDVDTYVNFNWLTL